MRYTARPGGIGNSTAYRTIQEFLGIENVVDLFVLKQTVMDTGSGHVEILADKRGSGRDLIADLLLIILPLLAGIHTFRDHPSTVHIRIPLPASGVLPGTLTDTSRNSRTTMLWWNWTLRL